MKPTEKHKKKNNSKVKQAPKKKNNKILIVAQEIKFARLLSGNEKRTRDKVLKTLKKWLLNCFQKNYEFKEDDFSRVWKGLFYAVWMSDKPLVQEDLCESISGILDLFPPEHICNALLMVRAGFRILATEWYGIDQHRMDKFLMLVRRYLRGSLRCLLRCKWSLDSCKHFSEMLTNKDGILAANTPTYARNATSMILHIIDCFLEELSKVSKGKIPEHSLAELLRPFCSYICWGQTPALYIASRRLLTQLVRQSDLGLRYQHSTEAWQKMGCPEGGPDALELVLDDDGNQSCDEDGENSDDDNKPLDPRAGRVDVILHSLPVPCKDLVLMLKEMLPKTGSKAQKRVRICLERFEKLAKEEYPLRITDDCEITSVPGSTSLRQSARILHDMEKKLIAASDELALRGLSRKHRKRLLSKTRAGQSIIEEMEGVVNHADHNSESTNGAWTVEETEPISKKLKRSKHPDKKANKENLSNKNRKSLNQDNKTEKVNKVLNKSKDKIKKCSKLALDNKKIEKKVVLQNADAVKSTSKIKNSPTLIVNKVKKFHKNIKEKETVNKVMSTPKKVKFVLKNNSMQGPIDYYKSVRQSPNIPFDSSKQPSKTNLKPSTPSPINPFLKKKLKIRN